MADWRHILTQAVAERSQAAVARQLGVSASTVHRLLHGTYGADTHVMARRILETWGNEHVQCPILGQIALQRCSAERRKPFAASSPQRVLLHRVCKTCANNPQREDVP